MKKIRLGEIACARSGDKGAGAKVGVSARTPAAFDLLRGELSEVRVHVFFKPLSVGEVTRYELPNLLAFNFILPGILDGGGSVSMRIDAQGKALGQLLLEMLIDVPDDFLK